MVLHEQWLSSSEQVQPGLLLLQEQWLSAQVRAVERWEGSNGPGCGLRCCEVSCRRNCG